ncbi:MAG: Rid family detoxifying hydrolase [Tissierellia bacterium]|nr:Rid family detoxifying hydrolase [Tissierellia bacterium]
MDFVKTDRAPKAIGPYSQASIINDTVYVSGQLPINMESGQLETDIEKATLASLTNVLEIVKAAGSSLEQIAKVNVFVKNIDDFDKVNAIYADFFKNHKPARALVEVAKLPKDAVIEIEAIAHV